MEQSGISYKYHICLLIIYIILTGLVQDHCQEKDDAFKKEFKRFRRPTPEDMKQVIDFNQPEHFKTEV